MGVADPEKRYNLTWMDRLNLENLVLASRAICAAAQARTDSRGAHYREDFPETSDLAASHYTVVRADGRQLRGHDRAGRLHPRAARANRCCRRRRNDAMSGSRCAARSSGRVRQRWLHRVTE